MADGGVKPDGRPAAVARVRSRPIAVYLFILSLVALVPAFVFSAVLLQRNNEAQERVVETLITGNARAVNQAVDREINANLTTLKVLASQPALLAGNLASFHARVSEALEGTGAFVYIVDKDMNSSFTTRLPFDQQKPVPVSDPESARRALETGEVVISGVVRGRVSGLWVVNILLPVRQPGAETFVLGLSREASQLGGALAATQMPDGWNVAVVDGSGTVVATTDREAHPAERFPMADVSALGTTDGWQVVQRDGVDSLVVTQKSALTGWSVVAWARRDMVARPLADAFWSLLFGGILLAVLVVLVIYWVSLQIGRSVLGLAADAKRLGAGQPVEPRPFPIAEIETVSDALGEASRRRQGAETEVRFLMRELAHRSKNQMTVIAAMAKQTARGADSVPEFVGNFERRIFGLARSTDLLLAHGVAGVDLRELLVSQIDPICPVDGDRVVVEGPSVRINGQAAQIVGMAAHELSTNAVKYGAFAREPGRLEVRWQRRGESVAFTWREHGAQLGTAVHRRGFGTTVLENMVGRSLGAQVERLVHPDGLEWRFDIPLASLDPSASLNARAEAGPAKAEAGAAGQK